ncbi:LacI family transcriptional regulator [Pantoea sp. PNA 14-12]|uniref:LacI family DNA-binding transcriptional regulator n=1 Tax=Pantoea TaxID=53335 RepID=UPI00067B4E51|nr:MULTISPECIES: LacI family DNA-binding transcriptional regulator [Pantoea]MDF7784987.1 LacI family DNA-binding transcriptional regulator [Pantoea stewartii]MDK2634740.1 LacI family DNA-binding transcriptional regulator [Pantoea stewartii subsp. indologenes]MEB6534127.1 LacI family transcriptional regulator [Pantoea stewartii]TDS72331.1 LacI family transcriptional regulator [Pantoea sp. PNA 14-12]UYK98598.1 LacI family transcriptional regulator [Pantoea stewartii]
MTSKKQQVRGPTVADVARQAGVSKAQAARALGGYGAVSEEVQIRVTQAAETLGYRPNELARSMNTGRSNTIGVIVGDIENPHFGLALRGMADVARQAGFHLLLSNSDETVEEEREAVRVMLDKRVDGIIVAPCSSLACDNDHLKQVLTEGRALMTFDRSVEGLDVETIQADFLNVARDATQLLLNAGHHRIAYLSSMRIAAPYTHAMSLGPTPVAQRVKGMIDAHHDAGMALDPNLVRLNALNEACIEQILTELLSLPEPPSALIASDNLIAMGILRGLARRGLRVPEDISFVMYDDFPWTELMTPALTVVAQPVYEMGREAARRLICHIRQQPAGALPAFDSWMVVRGSVGPVRAGGKPVPAAWALSK